MTFDAEGFGRSNCIVCGLVGRWRQKATFFELICDRCGHFQYTEKAEQALSQMNVDQRAAVAEWIWRQNRAGIVPQFDQASIIPLMALPRLSFGEKRKRLISYIADRSPFPGVKVEFRQPSIEAMLQTFEPSDVDLVIQDFVDIGLARRMGSNTVGLTGQGLIQAEEWGRSLTASRQGFVAMWFDNSLTDAWTNGFAPGISRAGYEPVRIDKREHVNKICDEVIAEIRRSRFVVADYTGHRGGVYFEAGYAMGREIPTIFTCRKDHMNDLHFDLRQYNCIDWTSADELGERLQRRIEAVIGDGPQKRS
jgi:hypothetical protein